MKDNSKVKTKTAKKKLLIKKCHVCGHINESHVELLKCDQCTKGFLPLNYFSKIHAQSETTSYHQLFSEVEELTEDDLIKGIYVIW